jgi:hypothetical protein
MQQRTKISYLVVIILSLVVGLASLAAVAKSDNAKSNNSNKSSQSQGKNKTANLKNYEKPDKAKGTTNSQLHQKKTEEVVQNLEQVATQEESSGNTQISNKIEQVAQEQDQTQEQTSAAIEGVEKRGKIKTFLVGTDYKNLGQLRSSLVHNRNQIRKLTQTISQVQNGGDVTLLQEQLTTLMQERERIKAVITANESSFSLFGWVTRFLANYEQKPIDEQEEGALTEEVEGAIEDVDNTGNVDTTTPTTPLTNPATMPVQ